MTPQDKIPIPETGEPEHEAEIEQLSKRPSEGSFDNERLAAQPEDVYANLPPCDFEGAIEFLRFLREEDDAEEQRETMEYLIRVLDEDRPSYRKLFPEELKGVTW
jgi:hypothetical protein